MKKPEKIDMFKKCIFCKKHFLKCKCGKREVYNTVIGYYEAYHKQVLTELADEEKIYKIVNFATDEYINSLVDDEGVDIYIAKAISAMIKEKIT